MNGAALSGPTHRRCESCLKIFTTESAAYTMCYRCRTVAPISERGDRGDLADDVAYLLDQVTALQDWRRAAVQDMRRLEKRCNRLRGALIRRLRKVVPDDIVSVNVPPPPASKSLEEVRDAVCAAFGIHLRHLCSPSRKAPLAAPRQAYYLLARDKTTATNECIALAVGRTDHTTVCYGVGRARELLRSDEAFATKVAIAREVLDDA